MFRFGREFVSARFRLQRNHKRAPNAQPQELDSKPCWSSERQDVLEAGTDIQENMSSSPRVRRSGPRSVRAQSQSTGLCSDGLMNRPRRRELGLFAAALIRRIMSGSKVAPVTSKDQQNASSSTIICDGNPLCLARDMGETGPRKQHTRQGVDSKQSGRTAKKFSLRNRLGMGIFRRGLVVVPPDQKDSAKRSVRTSLYARGPDEAVVNFGNSRRPTCDECCGQNAKAGGGDDAAGMSSAPWDGSDTHSQPDDKRRSLEIKTTDINLATDNTRPVEKDVTGATIAGQKEGRKKTNRGLPTRNTNRPTSRLNAKIKDETDAMDRKKYEHDLVPVSCKFSNGMKRRHLAPSSLKSSEEDTILMTEKQPKKNTLDMKPIDLANEIRELPADARWRRIQTITSHLKKRIDLLTLRKFSSRVLPYTSNEGRKIEENAGKAEKLLEQLHTLSKGAGKINTEDKTIYQKSVLVGKKLNKHQDANPKKCTTKQKTLLGKKIKVTALGFVKEKLHTGRKGPAQKRNNKQHMSSKPNTTTICPAVNKRTYNKSSNQTQHGSPLRGMPAAENKDLVALGLPILRENEMEQVMTKKGAPFKLGSGDYGEVFLVRSTSDNSLMAVKRLTDVGSRNAPDRRTADMLQEIKAMEAVRACKIFPKFLGVLDTFSFAQEFVGNQQKHTSWSAYKLLFKSPKGPFLLPLDWARISCDVTTGLKALHQAGWTHNDLHIGNIMIWRDPKKLTATWEAKIIDLGKASPINDPPPLKNLNRMEKVFAQENCPQMAPEIVEGRSCYNVKSDVYSLGVVFQDIAKQNRLLSCFERLGKGCVAKDADKRPELTTVLKKLNQLCCRAVNRKCTKRGAK